MKVAIINGNKHEDDKLKGLESISYEESLKKLRVRKPEQEKIERVT